MYLSGKESEELIKALQKDYVIYAPKVYANQGRYSYTDSIRYGVIEHFSEIEYKKRSDYAIKEVLIPIRQTVAVEIGNTVVPVPPEETKPIFMFLRACDLHALNRLDQTFGKDSFYQKRRAGMKTALIECGKGFDTCFCVSMNTNTADQFDMGARFENDGISLEIRDKELEAYLPPEGKQDDYSFTFVTENEMKVRTPKIREWDWQTQAEIKDLELWKSYEKRCIGCGSCNMACSTCTCVQEKKVPAVDGKITEIQRVWGGCQVVTTHALSKNSVTAIVPKRIRQRVMDKFYRPMLKESKEQICVGCGRFIDICPRLINFGTTVNRFCDELDQLYEASGATNEQ